MKVMASGINSKFRNYAPASKLNAKNSSSLSQTAGMANNAAYPDTSVLKANFISFKGNQEAEEFDPYKVLQSAVRKCITFSNYINNYQNLSIALNKYNAPYLLTFMQHKTKNGRMLSSKQIAERLGMASTIKRIEGMSDETKEKAINALACAEDSNGNLRFYHNGNKYSNYELYKILGATNETNAPYLKGLIEYRTSKDKVLSADSIADRLRMISAIKGKREIDDKTKEEVIHALAYAEDNEGNFSFGYHRQNQVDYNIILEETDETNVDY